MSLYAGRSGKALASVMSGLCGPDASGSVADQSTRISFGAGAQQYTQQVNFQQQHIQQGDFGGGQSFLSPPSPLDGPSVPFTYDNSAMLAMKDHGGEHDDDDERDMAQDHGGDGDGDGNSQGSGKRSRTRYMRAKRVDGFWSCPGGWRWGVVQQRPVVTAMQLHSGGDGGARQQAGS